MALSGPHRRTIESLYTLLIRKSLASNGLAVVSVVKADCPVLFDGLGCPVCAEAQWIKLSKKIITINLFVRFMAFGLISEWQAYIINTFIPYVNAAGTSLRQIVTETEGILTVRIRLEWVTQEIEHMCP